MGPEPELPPSPISLTDEDTKFRLIQTNRILLEAFEWHLPSDHLHWRRLRQSVSSLSAIGITDLWLPPGSKAKDAESNGYDIYDAYDLGEFDQKGTVPTKWGTRKELIDLKFECSKEGMGLMWDAILNHRAFADGTETVKVVEVDPRDRRIDITEPYEITAWTKFDFAARKGKYSTFTYNKSHFNGTDWNQNNEKRAIYRFTENGKDWAQDVGKMQGNADYLMLENLDYRNAEVVEETKSWAEWIMQELDLSGFRLDAVQHYSWRFANSWMQHLNKRKIAESGKELLNVGEFWNGDVNALTEWLDNMSPDFKLFDVPLMYKLARLSWDKESHLRDVFRDTLVERRPEQAVTFMRNHDTQKGQDMETPIKNSFMSHAYSLILLRRCGLPCIFFGDLYGVTGPFPEPPSCGGKLPGLILARRMYAHGEQKDHFEKGDCIGWVRSGDEVHEDGMAVIMSWTNGEEREQVVPMLEMDVGVEHAGEIWTDVLGFEWAEVRIDENGWGRFRCQRNGLACFVNSEARGRDRFPVRFDADFLSLM